jgi:hypothetical protein
MKVTKKYEAKSIEKQVLGDRDVKWRATRVWKGRWRREIPTNSKKFHSGI